MKYHPKQDGERDETTKEDDAFVSRRAFVVGTLAGTAGLWIQASMPRPLAAADARSNAEPSTLTAVEWQLVEAITGRILPTDDTPGAIEAGCVNFIDKALAHEDAAALPLYRGALAEFDRVCASQRDIGFAAHPKSEQDQLLSSLERGQLEGWRAAGGDQSTFFSTIRMHTLLGFVLDPTYGGNRDHVGWQTMGFPGAVHHLGGSRPKDMLDPAGFVPIWKRGGLAET